MVEYVKKQELLNDTRICKDDSEDVRIRKLNFRSYIKSLPPADVAEKEMILDFIEDNRPTDVQTDWERGCAYICDEIEKLLL